MKYELRKFLKKAAVITLLSGGYSIWLWRDSVLPLPLLIANILSVIGMVFLVVGLFGLVHNTKALAAFTYSFRFVANMVRNARNRDAATDEEIISYPDYRDQSEKWPTVPYYLAAAALFIGLSLLIWALL